MTNVMTLGEVATYINGRAFKPSEWEEAGLPIIRIQNLTESNKKYNYSSRTFDEKFRIQNDDLLFAWSASLGAFIWKGGDAWLNQHIFKVEPKPFIQKRYLYYFLLYVIADLYAKTHGSGMVHITKGPFMSTPIQVPSRPEQKRIVEKIDELFSDLDAAESELRVAKEKLEIYWHAILEKAFSKYRGPNRFLSDFIENPKYGTSQKCNYDISDATAVYRIPNIDHQTGNIDHSDIKFTILGEDEKEKLKLIPGDILMIRSNGSISLVGRCALVKTCDIKGVFAGYLIRLRIKDIKQLRPEYLLYFLSTHEARQYIESKAKSTSGVNNINAEEIKQILIPICDIGEQSKIIKEIEIHEPLHKKSSQLIDFSLCKLNILRQSILKQAFEGGLA